MCLLPRSVMPRESKFPPKNKRLVRFFIFFFFFFPITKDRDKLMTEILPQGESPVDKMEKEPASRLNCTPIVLLPMTLECNTPAECQRILFAKVPARWAVKVR